MVSATFALALLAVGASARQLGSSERRLLAPMQDCCCSNDGKTCLPASASKTNGMCASTVPMAKMCSDMDLGYTGAGMTPQMNGGMASPMMNGGMMTPAAGMMNNGMMNGGMMTPTGPMNGQMMNNGAMPRPLPNAGAPSMMPMAGTPMMAMPRPMANAPMMATGMMMNGAAPAGMMMNNGAGMMNGPRPMAPMSQPMMQPQTNAAG